LKRAYKCWLSDEVEDDAELVEALHAEDAAKEFTEKRNDMSAGELLLPDESHSIDVLVRFPDDSVRLFRMTAYGSVNYFAEKVETETEAAISGEGTR
jgi:hypothetical protein